MNRSLLSIALLLLSAIPVVFAQTDSLKIKIEQTLNDKNAEVGFAVCGPDSKDIISINGDKRFPMQSVFKFHVALAVLHEVDKGKISLNNKIEIRRESLLPDTWSPIRDKYPDGDIALTVAELIEYTVAQSDNNGCDILLELIGGPLSAEQYIHETGVTDVAIKVNEHEQQKDWNIQFLNWTTPKAAIALLSDFYKGKILSPESNSFLIEVMESTSTGTRQLKGLLPQGTIIAHKTGSSGTNEQGVTAALNDIGIITLPDSSAYAIAVFITNSKENKETNEAIIADISKLVWDYFSASSIK